MKKLILIILGMLIFYGCTHRLVDFTIISSKNLDLSKAGTFERSNQRIEGEDMVHIISFIPTGQVNIKEALDRAIEKVPGCVAILDGVILSKTWWVPYIYGQMVVIVEGTPLIDPSLAMNNNELPNYIKIEFDRNGEIKNDTCVSQEEYITLKAKVLKEGKETKFKNSIELQ